jgi:hypothetical protein
MSFFCSKFLGGPPKGKKKKERVGRDALIMARTKDIVFCLYGGSHKYIGFASS